MLMITSYAYNTSEDLSADISRSVRKKDKLTRELRTGNQLTAALATLNGRTIDESDVTRLNLLRYLGIEEAKLEFLPQQPAEASIGRTKLFTREFIVKGVDTYASALEQLDFFYDTQRARIDTVTVTPSKKGYGDLVSYELRGIIYGLRK